MFLDMNQFHNETLFKSDNWSFVLQYHLHSTVQLFVSLFPLYLIYLAEMEMGKNRCLGVDGRDLLVLW